MNRRGFVKFLALMAAGAAAKPEQIAAFQHYYELNSPEEWPLVAVDEIFISGLAKVSTRLRMDFFKDGDLVLPLGLNAFGGIVRWAASPDQKIITSPNGFKWRIQCLDGFTDFMEQITGHISYIDRNGFRISRPLVNAVGSLVV